MTKPATYVRFAALPFPDNTIFIEIRASDRLRCERCGRREVSVMPDWRGYKPQGGG